MIAVLSPSVWGFSFVARWLVTVPIATTVLLRAETIDADGRSLQCHGVKSHHSLFGLVFVFLLFISSVKRQIFACLFVCSFVW